MTTDNGKNLWERPFLQSEIHQTAANWSLASDARVLLQAHFVLAVILLLISAFAYDGRIFKNIVRSNSISQR